MWKRLRNVLQLCRSFIFMWFYNSKYQRRKRRKETRWPVDNYEQYK